MNRPDRADARQALIAMCKFLEAYWQRGKSEDIAALLGSLALQDDGECADPALWKDWNASFLEATKDQQAEDSLEILEPAEEKVKNKKVS